VRTKGNWTGDRKQTTLWTIPSGGQDTETIHGTQKPVECMRRPMLNNSMPGEAVYEPFLGSGTTLIAAQTSGRSCFAIELDPRMLFFLRSRVSEGSAGDDHSIARSPGTESYPAAKMALRYCKEARQDRGRSNLGVASVVVSSWELSRYTAAIVNRSRLTNTEQVATDQFT
jgi:hypothetical protein